MAKKEYATPELVTGLCECAEDSRARSDEGMRKLFWLSCFFFYYIYRLFLWCAGKKKKNLANILKRNFFSSSIQSTQKLWHNRISPFIYWYCFLLLSLSLYFSFENRSRNVTSLYLCCLGKKIELRLLCICMRAEFSFVFFLSIWVLLVKRIAASFPYCIWSTMTLTTLE